MRFEGKAGLVTGAGSRIGRATAKGFAQRGGAVAVADINGDNANRVAAEITAAGGKAIAIVADVTRTADIEMMISRTTDEFGRLDFLPTTLLGCPGCQVDHWASPPPPIPTIRFGTRRWRLG
jgi:NAD(P)-dependent dehydrogenase (short-subunit alcohol dehydrogenase family)